jgi:hypothetical protein
MNAMGRQEQFHVGFLVLDMVSLPLDSLQVIYFQIPLVSGCAATESAPAPE